MDTYGTRRLVLDQEHNYAEAERRAWAAEIAAWNSPDLPRHNPLAKLTDELNDPGSLIVTDGDRIIAFLHGTWITSPKQFMDDPILIDRILVADHLNFVETAAALLRQIVDELSGRHIVISTRDNRVLACAIACGFVMPYDGDPITMNMCTHVLTAAGRNVPDRLALINEPDQH